LQDAKTSVFLICGIKMFKLSPQTEKRVRKLAFLSIQQYIDALQACGHFFRCPSVNSDSERQQMEIFLPCFRNSAPLKNQILQITSSFQTRECHFNYARQFYVGS
jgi:hypothetical protein